MNNFLIALMFGVGVGGFVWSKIGRQTGNANPGGVYTTAAVAGVVAFLFFFILLKFVLNLS